MSKEQTEPEQPIAPPASLSEKAQAIWLDLVPRRCRSLARRELLAVALAALDRADAAQRQIEQQGMVLVSPKSGVAHVSPLVKVEADSRRLFAKLWGQLGLAWDQRIDGAQ